MAFFAIIALRLAVGFHFFNEGRSKLESGTFTSQYFLDAATGPLAPSFRQLLEDPDGQELLCVRREDHDDGGPRWDLDPESVYQHWDRYLEEVTRYYGFGSERLQQELADEREQLAQQIQTARAQQDDSVDTRRLELRRAEAAADILKVRQQLATSEEILQHHKELLADWLDGNKTEVVSHFATAHRLQGFDRDGKHRTQAMREVDSLRAQVEEIAVDRDKKLKQWKQDVSDIWESLENQLNSLAVAKQSNGRTLPLPRPYAPSDSLLKRIDHFIPWFDTIVGVLLIVGLFTRLASLAGAGFLFSVVMTQPFWVPTAEPTYYQWVELTALLVLFSLRAGTIGGLDYFFTRRKPVSEPQSNVESGVPS